MTPTATLASYKDLSSFADFFTFPKSDKSVSTYKKVIEVTTNKKSVLESKKLIKFLNETILPNLPTKKEDFNTDLVKNQIENTKENLLNINKMFDTIDTLFDSGDDVNIDDTYMLTFLSNMKNVQSLLSYIHDYLSLAIEVNESNIDCNKNGKTYTLVDFINTLKSA